MSFESQTLIIIPTYNEKENLTLLLPDIFNRYPSIHVLIVDDGSPDGTGAFVKELQAQNTQLHLMERAKKSGLGSAYLAGFKWALSRDYQFIFEMDADYSHHPQYVANFLKAAENADLVLGSRYKDGKISVVNWDWKRLLLSYCANIYARMITGLPVSDATGGFKCFRRSAIESLDLDKISAGGYSFQIEISYKLWKKGFRIAETPIVFTDRTIGESKLSGKIIREALFLLIKLRFGKNT